MSYQSSHPCSTVFLAVVILTVALLGPFAFLAPTHSRPGGTPHVMQGIPDQLTAARKGAPDNPAVSEPPPAYRP